MSSDETPRYLEMLNQGIEAKYAQGNPIEFEYFGKPRLHIPSFKPLVVEQYGRFNNKAPYIEGDFTLRNLLSKRRPNGSYLIYAGLEAEHDGYGVLLDSRHSHTIPTLQNIGSIVGIELDIEVR